MGILTILKWNAIGIALLPPTILVSCIIYENILYYWHKPKRKRAMLLFKFDEEDQNQEEDEEDNNNRTISRTRNSMNQSRKDVADENEDFRGQSGIESNKNWLHLAHGNSLQNRSSLEMTLYNLNMRIVRSIMIAGKYINPFPEWQDRNILGLFEHLKWHITRHRYGKRRIKHGKKHIEEIVPITEPNFEVINRVKQNPKDYENQIVCTWIGQSCMLIQMEGLTILTDPHFSKTSTGSWIGPRRLRTAPCQLEQLPPIDLVLVSHDHYDHLDLNTIKDLNSERTTWCVPLGLGTFLKKYNVKKVIELDWWQEIQYKSVLIAATPAQHWSGRYILDTNRSLWSSFVVKGPHTSFFHCGDTGYCRVFKDIGKKYGPFTLSALPIGSYAPRWFMKHQHIHPSEAATIHQDLKAKHSIGVHWGTFVMSDEPIDEPPRLFLACHDQVDGELWVTKQGETIVLK